MVKVTVLITWNFLMKKYKIESNRGSFSFCSIVPSSKSSASLLLPPVPSMIVAQNWCCIDLKNLTPGGTGLPLAPLSYKCQVTSQPP
jgi:hypothetical protein